MGELAIGGVSTERCAAGTTAATPLPPGATAAATAAAWRKPSALLTRRCGGDPGLCSHPATPGVSTHASKHTESVRLPRRDPRLLQDQPDARPARRGAASAAATLKSGLKTLLSTTNARPPGATACSRNSPRLGLFWESAIGATKRWKKWKR